MGYKIKDKITGMRHQKVYIEEPTEVVGSKGKIRNKIVKEVSDRDDLIADLFKLAFINLSLIKELYSLVDLTNLEPTKKELFEKGFKKLEETETILDIYLQNNDLSFIDRILERQDKITKIIKEVKQG